jgi:hypothetical protein
VGFLLWAAASPRFGPHFLSITARGKDFSIEQDLRLRAVFSSELKQETIE